MTSLNEIGNDIFSERKAHVPDGYLLRESDQTGEEATTEPQVAAASSVIAVSTVRVRNVRLRATRPFPVKLTMTDDYFYLESEGLCVYAIGKTYAEALQEFCEQVVDIFRHYQGLSDDEVIGEARRLRRLFTGLFIEERNAP